MRIGEASKLQWKDIDFKRRLIFCNNPEKHGNSRVFNVSQKLLTMIDMLPKKNNHVFSCPNGYFFKVGLFRQRRKLAKKLGNPRLNQVHFHTLRHWKATMLYHQTKDILHVKEFLGHKNIECTMIYIQLNKALFTADSDEFNCKIARDEREVKELVEAGFEYVCDMENAKFFRKRK